MTAQRFGEGDVTWLEKAQAGAVSNAVVVIYDETGKSMMTSAMRTKNVPVGSMYVGEDVFCYVDNPKGPTTGYAKYLEVHLMPEAAPGSIAQGYEFNVLNHKPPVETGPYNPNAPGLTEVLRLGANGQNGPSPFPASHAFLIGGTGYGPGFLRGYVFADGATVTGEVLTMAKGQMIAWQTPGGKPGPHVRSDCDNPANAMKMIFFNGGMALQTPDGINRHIFWNDGRYTHG